MDRARCHVAPGGQSEAPGVPCEQQEGEQQCRAAHLAHGQGCPAGPGTGRICSADAYEDVERQGDGLPTEQEAERVTRYEHRRDSPQEQEIARPRPAPDDTAVRRDPGDETGGDGYPETAGDSQKQAGQGVEAERGRPEAERGSEGDDASRVVDGDHSADRQRH